MPDKPTDAEPDANRDNVLGVRGGTGYDQYAGRVAGGESGGGAYPNPHSGHGDPDAPAKDGAGPRDHVGGQTNQGYHGGGQAGDDGRTGHHAASRTSAGSDASPTYQDHASQLDGPARQRFEEAVDRAERLHPGDTDQGVDGRPVTGKP